MLVYSSPKAALASLLVGVLLWGWSLAPPHWVHHLPLNPRAHASHATGAAHAHENSQAPQHHSQVEPLILCAWLSLGQTLASAISKPFSGEVYLVLRGTWHLLLLRLDWAHGAGWPLIPRGPPKVLMTLI